MKQDREATIENNDASRRHVVDACIVRVMKSRGKLYHTELSTEIVKQLESKFLPQPRLLKERIEHLLEKEYLMRDDEERNLYHYCS